MSSLVWLLLLLVRVGQGQENSTERRTGRILNMFQLTRFPNDECVVSGTKVRPGLSLEV